MSKLVVEIDFADTSIHAIDHFHNIQEAADSAGLRLFGRHNIRLQPLRLTDDGRVLIEIMVPDDKAKGFQVGPHLRGIARYLLKLYGDCYRGHLVGNRLLTYREVKEPSEKVNQRTCMDALEMVQSFTNLLLRADDESKNKIERIQKILIESD